MTKKDRRNEDYGAKLAITPNGRAVGSEAAAEQGRKKVFAPDWQKQRL